MKRLVIILSLLLAFILFSLYYLYEQANLTNEIVENLNILYESVENENVDKASINMLNDSLKRFYTKFDILFDNQKLSEIKISQTAINVLAENFEKSTMLSEIEKLKTILKQELIYTIPSFGNVF